MIAQAVIKAQESIKVETENLLQSEMTEIKDMVGVIKKHNRSFEQHNNKLSKRPMIWKTRKGK